MRIAACALAALLITAFAATAIYGWWHRATHATFEVQLVYNAAGGAGRRLLNGQIEFRSDSGDVLAHASIDARRGVVWLTHPQLGRCGPQRAREAYLECVRAQSEWIPQWAERVRRAHVMFEDCSFNGVPVTLYTRRDNVLLWWLSWQWHVLGGSKPYTRYVATIAANQKVCGQ